MQLGAQIASRIIAARWNRIFNVEISCARRSQTNRKNHDHPERDVSRVLRWISSVQFGNSAILPPGP